MREPWPAPERRAARRGAQAGSLALHGVAALLGLVGAGHGPGLGDWQERSLRDRHRRVCEGYDEHVNAAAFGAASWCPRFPEWGVLTLSIRDVTYSQGRTRVVPVETLTPVGVRAARSAPAPVRLRRGWVLDLAGPDGTGSIALRSTDDLALLGGVAGWPPPPGWPEPAP